jgi:hypothetical protein
MFDLSRLLIVVSFVFYFASFSFAQASGAIPIGEIIARSSAQRSVFIDEFRNLLAQETKTFQILDKKDVIKKTRTVGSTFLVYQLAKDNNRIAEFRSVLSVDGKPIENTEGRSQEFFEKIVKAENSKKELEKLQSESLRYDEGIFISDLTLFQAVALVDNLRPYFDFTLEGKEMLGGNVVYVVRYSQNKASPYVFANLKKQPADGKLSVFYDAGIGADGDLNERLSGRFWIDAQTFQVRREVREMSLQPKDFASRAKLAESTFEYDNSDFNILTPKKITHVQYRLKKNEQPAKKEAVIIFEYSKFRKPDVDVKEVLEEKP